MACDISLGRLEPCKQSVGGLRAIYFINYDSEFYAYDLKGENTFDEENSNERGTGSNFWTQTGTITLKKQDLATQTQAKLLASGRPQIIIEDYNGNFRLAGAQHGCEVSVNTVSGSAMGDLSGYNITFIGMEKAPADFIDSAIMDDSEGFTVTEGT